MSAIICTKGPCEGCDEDALAVTQRGPGARLYSEWCVYWHRGLG